MLLQLSKPSNRSHPVAKTRGATRRWPCFTSRESRYGFEMDDGIDQGRDASGKRLCRCRVFRSRTRRIPDVSVRDSMLNTEQAGQQNDLG
jgi:hypothetical protein